MIMTCKLLYCILEFLSQIKDLFAATMFFYNNSKKQLILIISVLLVYIISVFIIYENIKNQERELIHSRLIQSSMIATKKVSDYIGPVQNLVTYVTDVLKSCEINWKDINPASNQLIYLLNNYPQFSAVFIVSNRGDGYGMGRLQGDTLVFISMKSNVPLNETRVYKMARASEGFYSVVSEHTYNTKFSLLDRPWVIASIDPDEIYCTNMYKFYYSNQYGLTISKKYITLSSPKEYSVIGLDILAGDVLKFLYDVKENTLGDIFFLNNSLEIIPSLSNLDTLSANNRQFSDSISGNSLLYEHAAAEYIRLGQPKEPFEINYNNWCCHVNIRKINLSKSKSIYLALVIPDYLSKTVARIKMILLASFILIILFVLYLFYLIRIKHKHNRLLIEKNLALANSGNLFQVGKFNIPVKSDSNEEVSIITEDNANGDSFTFNSRTAVRILDDLERLISEKFFLMPGATLYNISKKLNTNTTYLSKIINDYKGKNYSEFLNELRINEAILQISEEDILKKFTLEGFAHELGFKSKSSFNSAFKKYTGFTPSEFITSAKKKK